MFYVAQMYMYPEDKVQPILSFDIFEGYETYDEAFDHFKEGAFDTGVHLFFDKDEPPSNVVTDYSCDRFDEYRHFYLIINADSYDDCEDAAAVWALDYLNNILKERWLEDRMKDLPTWYVVLGNEVEEASLDILYIESIDRNSVAKCEISMMMDGWYRYIPTELSHIIVAKEYIPNDLANSYDLVIQAKDEEEVKEVCKDFIRLYTDEYE